MACRCFGSGLRRRVCAVAFYSPAAAAGIMLHVCREKLTLAPEASKYGHMAPVFGKLFFDACSDDEFCDGNVEQIAPSFSSISSSQDQIL